MLRHCESKLRKSAAVFVLVALVGLFCLVNGADAKNKKSNPSDPGQSNGVAHRVAALEAAQTDTDEAILLLLAALTDLQSQVSDLETRVADLEAAAADPAQ